MLLQIEPLHAEQTNRSQALAMVPPGLSSRLAKVSELLSLLSLQPPLPKRPLVDTLLLPSLPSTNPKAKAKTKAKIKRKHPVDGNPLIRGTSLTSRKSRPKASKSSATTKTDLLSTPTTLVASSRGCTWDRRSRTPQAPPRSSPTNSRSHGKSSRTNPTQSLPLSRMVRPCTYLPCNRERNSAGASASS